MSQHLEEVYNKLGVNLYQGHAAENQKREAIINEAMGKIFKIKLQAQEEGKSSNISEELILIGDKVELELDYGEDIDRETVTLALDQDGEDNLTIYTPIGRAIFAAKVGDVIQNVETVPGVSVNITICSKVAKEKTITK